MLTNKRRVTLLFPKVNDNDDKRSNYRLMSVLCFQKNLQSNKRHAYMHLSKREISILTRNLESFSHFLVFLINYLVYK